MPKKKTTKKPEKKKPEVKQKKLLPQQIAFCAYYMFGSQEKGDVFRIGHGGKSYAKAYGKDYETDRGVCDSNAYKLLRNAQILRHMDSLLESAGWNDKAIDSRLREIIFDGADKNAVAAIKLNYELKKRLIKQLDVTTKGRSIQLTAIEQLADELDEEDEDEIESIYDEIENEITS